MLRHKVISRFQKKPGHLVICHFAGMKARIFQGSPSGKGKTPEIPGGRDPKEAVLEAVLFLADEPVPAKKIASVCGFATAAETRKVLRGLQKKYIQEQSAFRAEEVAGGIQLFSAPELHPWIARVHARPLEVEMSSAMKETLSVVAYRQPITRADIEKIRGVNTSDVLRGLLEKNLIRICGRENSLGRPVLYGTTRKFLHFYGLKTLRELPRYEELSKAASREMSETFPENEQN